ncbi:MAG TPA: hypothetical protein VGN12_08110 [Pirellulales bacterium]
MSIVPAAGVSTQAVVVLQSGKTKLFGRELSRAYPTEGREVNQPESPNPLRWVIVLIVVGVAAWGVFHAIGAYRFNHNPARPLMVLGCVAAYLGFWGLMLRNRRARLARQSKQR